MKMCETPLYWNAKCSFPVKLPNRSQKTSKCGKNTTVTQGLFFCSYHILRSSASDMFTVRVLTSYKNPCLQSFVVAAVVFTNTGTVYKVLHYDFP